MSIQRVDVVGVTNNRTYAKRFDMQTARYDPCFTRDGLGGVSHFLNCICDASREDVNFNALHIFVSSSSLIGECFGETLGKINAMGREGL